MMYKYSKGLLPQPIHNLFIKNNNFHDHFTRQSVSLHKSRGNGEAIYRCFSFHAINIWNYMLKNVKTDVSFAVFKRISKTHIQLHEINLRTRP